MTFDRDPRAGAPDAAGAPSASGTPGAAGIPIATGPSDSLDPFADTSSGPFTGPTAPPDEPPPADLEPEPDLRSPRRKRLASIGATAAWVAIAGLIAFGGAGVVAVTNRPPVPGARPELTWSVDRALEPELATATGDLAKLSDDVDAFGAIGRQALISEGAGDSPGLQKAITEGEAQLAIIAGATDDLRARLAAIPGIGPDDPTRIGAALRVRYDRLVAALSATDGLADSWSNLTKGSLAAIDLRTSMTDHETHAAEAARLGRKAQYRRALAALDEADASLAAARQQRDRLAVSTDVSILSRWIDRNATYDAAVRKLWTALIKSKGKVNRDVRAAFAETSAAQAQLPPDSRALIVIMADVARGGLNQAVIEIEEARGKLSAASDALTGG